MPRAWAHGSNRSQTFAAHAAAVAQDCPAALGGIAGQKAVLPFAANFRRLVLAFHKSVTIRSDGQAAKAATPWNRSIIGARENISEGVGDLVFKRFSLPGDKR
jgi:hypothetical protein